MKVIIKDNERGFLFKNGIFVRMLTPGKHHIWKLLGESLQVLKTDGLIKLADLDNSIFLRDKDFKESTVHIDVPNGHMAIHLEEGKMVGTLPTGSYCFWNIFSKHTFLLVDKTKPKMTEIDAKTLSALSPKEYIRIEVPNGYEGLLYFDSVFQKKLDCGTYFFWNGSVRVNWELVDLRTQQLDIVGQEILTADRVSLRINFVCTYKITDSIKIITEINDYRTQIYGLTQLILREYVGKYRFDELLEQKENISSFVLEKLKAQETNLYVSFLSSGLKDIILPGEIREIMNTVLVAEKKAQANVITRREEVASTRSLLNTAKLMEENTTLYKLKELEYLERICDKVGNISVGGGNILNQLKELLMGR